MPTETFLKLSEEKKQKIIEAGKYEFSRVPLTEASIKNIAENAGIARGSFYQYFTSKEDLLSYILEINRETIDRKLEKISAEAKGDIFKFYIQLYNDLDDKCFNSENQSIYKKIFENVKACDDDIYEKMEQHRKDKFRLIRDTINTENLNIKDETDIDRMIEILNSVTMNSIVRSIKSKNKEKSKAEFLKKIEIIKKGM